jgi:hypothetical protein
MTIVKASPRGDEGFVSRDAGRLYAVLGGLYLAQGIPTYLLLVALPPLRAYLRTERAFTKGDQLVVAYLARPRRWASPLFEFRQDIEQIADEAVIGDLEDRRFFLGGMNGPMAAVNRVFLRLFLARVHRGETSTLSC